jgi:hypothetical protein
MRSLRSEQVAGDLLHPRPVGVSLDAGDLDLPSGDSDEEEGVVPNQPGHRDDLDGEEVGSRDRAQVGFDEGGPRRLPSSERGVPSPPRLPDVAVKLRTGGKGETPP